MISRRVFPPGTTDPATLDLGAFQAQSIRINNYGPDWLFLANAFLFIAPYTQGFVAVYASGVTTETVKVQLPSGATAPSSRLSDGGFVIELYQESLPPSIGTPYAIAPSSVQFSGDNPVPGQQLGYSWDSSLAVPNTAQSLGTVVAAPWLYAGPPARRGKEAGSFIQLRTMNSLSDGDAVCGPAGTLLFNIFSSQYAGGNDRILMATLSTDTTSRLRLVSGDTGLGDTEIPLFRGVVLAGTTVNVAFPLNGIRLLGDFTLASGNVICFSSIAGVTVSWLAGLAPGGSS